MDSGDDGRVWPAQEASSQPSPFPCPQCHTAGIPYADAALWSMMHDWDAVLQAIYDANIEDVPGTKAAYHPYSSWFLLGEIIRRISGVPFAQYVREQIFLPLGMDNCYIGMSKDTFERYHADGLFAELRTMTPKGKMLTKGTVQTAPHEVMASVPGSNGRGPAREWLKVFECLTNGGVGANGTRILAEKTVRMFSRRHRIGMFDVVQGILCDWTLGLFVRTGDQAQMCATRRHAPPSPALCAHASMPHAHMDSMGSLPSTPSLLPDPPLSASLDVCSQHG